MSNEDTTTAEEAPEATEDATTTAEPDSPEETDDKGDAWDPERAKRKIAKLNSEAANLRKRVNDAPKAEDVAAKDQKITDLERNNLRYDVAFDLGLPKQIAMRLQGNTREEMLEDAQQLVDFIAPAKRPTQKPTEALRGGLEPEKEPEETDPRKIAERMFRN